MAANVLVADRPIPGTVQIASSRPSPTVLILASNGRCCDICPVRPLRASTRGPNPGPCAPTPVCAPRSTLGGAVGACWSSIALRHGCRPGAFGSGSYGACLVRSDRKCPRMARLVSAAVRTYSYELLPSIGMPHAMDGSDPGPGRSPRFRCIRRTHCQQIEQS